MIAQEEKIGKKTKSDRLVFRAHAIRERQKYGKCSCGPCRNQHERVLLPAVVHVVCDVSNRSIVTLFLVARPGICTRSQSLAFFSLVFSLLYRVCRISPVGIFSIVKLRRTVHNGECEKRWRESREKKKKKKEK